MTGKWRTKTGGMTFEAIAKRLNVSHTTIIKIHNETLKKLVDDPTIRRLARDLGFNA